MKPETREVIASLDETAEAADLPGYSELADLILIAQALMPHSSLARNDWVNSVIKAFNRIHNK